MRPRHRGAGEEEPGASPWNVGGRGSFLDNFGLKERTGMGAHLHITEEAFAARGTPAPSSVSAIEEQLLLGLRPSEAYLAPAPAHAGPMFPPITGAARGQQHQQQLGSSPRSGARDRQRDSLPLAPQHQPQPHQAAAYAQPSAQLSPARYHHHHHSVSVIGSNASASSSPRPNGDPGRVARAIDADATPHDDFFEEVHKLRSTQDRDFRDVNVYGTPKPPGGISAGSPKYGSDGWVSNTSSDGAAASANANNNRNKVVAGGVARGGAAFAGGRRKPPSPMATMEANELREELKRLRAETAKLRESLGQTLEGDEMAPFRLTPLHAPPPPPPLPPGVVPSAMFHAGMYNISNIGGAASPAGRSALRPPATTPLRQVTFLHAESPHPHQLQLMRSPNSSTTAQQQQQQQQQPTTTSVHNTSTANSPPRHAPPLPIGIQASGMHPLAVQINRQYNAQLTAQAMEALLNGSPSRSPAPANGNGRHQASKSPSAAAPESPPRGRWRI